MMAVCFCNFFLFYYFVTHGLRVTVQVVHELDALIERGYCAQLVFHYRNYGICSPSSQSLGFQ